MFIADEHLYLPRRLNSNHMTDYGKDMTAVLKLAEVLPQSQLKSLSVADNTLDDAAKQALQAAAGSGVTLSM